MNRESSYEEVLLHLPLETRQALEFRPPSVRERTLHMLRELMCSWEEEGAQFDPIQWELLLTSQVKVITDMLGEIRTSNMVLEMMLEGTK